MSDPGRMTPKAILDEILRLAPEERLEILEKVWDSIGPDDFPVPQWHLDALEEDERNPSPVAKESWEEFKSRLLREHRR